MKKMKEITFEEYQSLVEKAKHHDKLYYIDNAPEISDYEYDQLIKTIEAIERDHPDWMIDSSPTAKPGRDKAKGFKTVTHRTKMLSLTNTYNEKELGEYIRRMEKYLENKKVTFHAELKIDGVAISIHYKKGKLVQAITRGDGIQGDDVTANVKTIASLPHTLKGTFPDDLEVRGEIFMPHKVFQKLNQEKEEAGEVVYANPRNAASGSLKLLDSSMTKKRSLDVIIYDIASEIQGITEQHQIPSTLKKMGLPVFAENEYKHCKNIKDILSFAHKVEKDREKKEFDIDGIVVKLDDIKSREYIGTTGKSPRWAVAYKFEPMQAETVIEDIQIQVGRTGILTPVAHLKPVHVAGSTISRATLHNYDEIQRKDIRIGDHVLIEKGGDVIPKVVNVVMAKRKKGSQPWLMPRKCPVCSAKVRHDKKEVAYRCSNENCRGKNLRRLIFFVAKEAMNIDHLGEKVVERLVERGLVREFADFFRLTKEDLATLEGFKDKSMHNLLQSIENAKHVPLGRFIFSLGIKFVGKQTADLLAEHFKNLPDLLHASYEELVAIDGIGEKTARALVEFADNDKHLQEIHNLLKEGIEIENPKGKKIHHAFSGKTFVLTGSLEGYTRLEATSLITARGGKVSSSVSKNTDFVLVGDEAGSKLQKAKKLGVRLLTEKEFQKLL